MVSFLCAIIIIFLIFFRDTVISGAASGLMIWYEYVVPVLLPFLLISNLFLINMRRKISDGSQKTGLQYIIYTVFSGLLCGYPVGARLSSELCKAGICRISTAALLIPLCNNASPMFIAGYVYKQVLSGKITLHLLFFSIYLPYVIPALVAIIKESKSEKRNVKVEGTAAVNTGEEGFISDSIRQITVIGIYIMIFSIMTEFIITGDINNRIIKAAGGFLEITRGTMFLNSLDFADNIKTALIVSLTSFGGISAIYQTKEVIKHSGLSIIQYVLLKTLGGIMSGFLIFILI